MPFVLEGGNIGQDLVSLGASGEQFEDVLDAPSQTSDARTTCAAGRLDGDPGLLRSRAFSKAGALLRQQQPRPRPVVPVDDLSRGHGRRERGVGDAASAQFSKAMSSTTTVPLAGRQVCSQ
jgi:hypothetical protein